MNNKYAYRENDILVHTDTEMVSRQYVDNIDDILILENKIETLEKHIKMFKNSLDLNSMDRKKAKIFFNTLVAVGIIACLASFCVGIGIGSLLIADAIKVSLLFLALPVSAGTLARLALCSNGATKKNIEKLKNRILLYNYELEQKKQDLDILKKESKKMEIPKGNEIKTVPTDYMIKNLRHKLSVVESFKENTECYIAMYQSGKGGAILKELEEKYKDRYVHSDLELIEFLILEHQKEQNEEQISKWKTKRKIK